MSVLCFLPLCQVFFINLIKQGNTIVSLCLWSPFHTPEFGEYNNTTHGLLRSTCSDILDEPCTFSLVTAGVCQLCLSVIIHFINHGGFKKMILVRL